MKKCPYCKAELEENARFCLYCMSSLDEKQLITQPPKRKRLLFIAGAIALAVLILILVCCAGRGNSQDPAQEIHPPGQTTDTGNTTASTSADQELPEETSADVDLPTDALFSEGTEGAGTKPDPTEAMAPVTPQRPAQTEPTSPGAPQQPALTEPTKPTASQQPAQTEPTKPTATQQPALTEPTKPTAPQQPAQTEPTKPTASQQPAQTEPASTSAPTELTEQTTPGQCDHRYQITHSLTPTCTEAGANTYTCSLCGDSYRETVSATGHSYREATCLQPQVCRQCSAIGAAALGHSYQNGSCSRCGKADPNDPRSVFEYREARGGDQLPADAWDAQTDVVITGVKAVAQDGIYRIPDYLDGKRVVGIMALAFSGTDARSITLGENVIYVAQNAFSGCYNVEALYIRSDALYLSRAAFIPAANRNCTMTIYCSAHCTVDDPLHGECFLKDIVRVYGAGYHEWDG